MRLAALAAFLATTASVLAAPAPDASLVAAGKARAAESPTRWEVRDLVHPKLGPIKVAIALNALTMQGRNDKIVSSVYLSCEKGTGNIAIELVNAPSSDYTRGLGPRSLPRMSCIGASGSRTDIAAKWEANELGDVMARGLAPSALRRCVALEILENVTVPAGWSRDSQPFAIDVAPYGREVDQVFGDCGENVVYEPELPVNRAQLPSSTTSRVQQAQAPALPLPEPSPPPAPAKPQITAQPAPVTPAPAKPQIAAPSVPVTSAPAVVAAAPASTPTPAPAAAAADSSWRRARTIAKGNSNVRASPGLDSGVVTTLPPGMPVMVQPQSGEWWPVKPRSGAAFSGYLRRDRFVTE